MFLEAILHQGEWRSRVTAARFPFPLLVECVQALATGTSEGEMVFKGSLAELPLTDRENLRIQFLPSIWNLLGFEEGDQSLIVNLSLAPYVDEVHGHSNSLIQSEGTKVLLVNQSQTHSTQMQIGP